MEKWSSRAGQGRGEETINFSEIVITPILGDDSCWLLVQFGLMKGGLLLFFSIILMHNLQCDLTSPPANDTPNTRRVTCVCRLKLLPSRRAITTTIFLFLFFAFCYCWCCDCTDRSFINQGSQRESRNNEVTTRDRNAYSASSFSLLLYCGGALLISAPILCVLQCVDLNQIGSRLHSNGF